MEIWSGWPNQEVFAHPEYVRMMAMGVGAPRAAVLHRQDGVVLYPFILRSIPVGGNEVTGVDITTPYGYGGRFVWNTSRVENIGGCFEDAFREWAAAQGVVSEFMRLSLFSDDLLPCSGIVRERMPNVVRTLDAPESEIWRDYEAKVRKNVQKALRNGVSVRISEGDDSVEQFHRIYSDTMIRRQAAGSYMYPIEWIQELVDGLQGQALFFEAIYRDEVVSTELALVSRHSVYSFLGGTCADSFDVRPNDLLKHELILWARGRGLRDYVIGGGYRPDDGIFRYKKAFAPRGIVAFRTGESIYDRETYDALVGEAIQVKARSGTLEGLDKEFFPLYRAP